jgi:hypothetical protein
MHTTRSLALACLIAFSGAALATGSHQPEPPAKPQPPAANSSSGASSSAITRSAQKQAQGQHQTAQGGHSSAAVESTVSARTGDNRNTIDASSYYTDVRQVPDLAMGTVVAVDCGFAGQAGAAGTGGAGFLGAGWTTKTCYALKVANAWAAVGEYEMACELWTGITQQMLEKRRGITSVDCAVIAKRMAATHPVVQPREEQQVDTAQFVTRTELDRAFRKSVSK